MVHKKEPISEERQKEIRELEELEKAMIKYIKYYNNERIMEKTKGLSPLEYRQQSFIQLRY